MKKHVLFLFATLLSLAASAHDFEVDGIYYNITSEADKTAEVTSSDGTEYSGSITVPATVTHNGVEYSVTSIGESAFYYCSSLTAITLPASVTSIGSSAFYGCESLTAITLPEGVTSIGYQAFYGCSSLTSITIPEGVTSIGHYAFQSCHSLTAITIPEGVTSIGHYAFEYCWSLTAITIPEDSKLTSIGDNAFYDCSSLTDITIPESVTSIGDYAFYGCSSLERVTINCANVGSWFSGLSSLKEIVLGEGVTSIGEDAFYCCSSLTAITLPEGVTSIELGAFRDCHSLTAITLPASVTSIGDYAFYYCSSLMSITIPASVTSIGGSAFEGCESLKTVINYSDLPLQRGSYDYGIVAYYADRVINVDEVIDGYAFKTIEGVHYLTGYIGDKTELTLPADYKGENYQIGERAFAYCSSLTSINIPEGVTSIGESAFYYCSSLTAITLPESVTSIGDYAFYGCSSLESIIIPESVTSIGESAFDGCWSLKTVINYSDLFLERGSTDNGSVACYADIVINIDEVIDGYAFKTIEGVHYLTGYIGDDTELILPTDYKGANYQIGDRAFYGCSSLTSITLPEGVTSIGESAFNGCSSLTSITIPESVTRIGGSAFRDCSSLKELTLGKGLKKIAAGAFAGCTALEKVTIYATRPPSIEGTGNAFFSDATYENATLYVPQGCIDKYQVMAGWSSFYTIEEMEGGTPNYLTLRQADNGEVGIVVDLGRTYKVRITAFEGWKIHSVTFNGEEVTAQLTEEGTFTTPALQADAVLNIAYEKIEDNAIVANARASRIKVQSHHGTLRITGAAEGEAISVYTTGGTLVAQESAESAETLITLPTGQVYIVTVADKVVKIGM